MAVTTSPVPLDVSPPPTASSTGTASPPCPLSEQWCQDALAPHDKCVALHAMPHFDWKPIPELVGLAGDELRICYGDPAVRDRRELKWRIPPGCAFEKVELEVHMLNGRATSARAHTIVTGQECM